MTSPVPAVPGDQPTGVVAEIHEIQNGAEHYRALAIWCPGCGLDDGPGLHMIPVESHSGPWWQWNGDLVNVTLEPSVKTEWANPELPMVHEHPRGQFVCHSFLRDGQWQFLADSTHALAGQTVPMTPLPDWCRS